MKLYKPLFYLLFFHSVSVAAQQSIFIDRATYMEETNEFYSSPVHKRNNGWNNESFSLIASQKDSLIYQNEESERYSIPNSLASRYFDNELVQDVLIFDLSNNLISEASFVRWEYFSDMISNKIIAVYKPKIKINTSLNSWQFYVISQNAREHIDKKILRYSPAELPTALEQKLRSNEMEIIEKHGFTLGSNEVSYFHVSIGNYYQMTFKNYIIESNSADETILKEESNEFIYGDVIPLPIRLNNKPVFLSEVYLPETDIMWNVVEVYRNGKYHVDNDNAIDFGM